MTRWSAITRTDGRRSALAYGSRSTTARKNPQPGRTPRAGTLLLHAGLDHRAGDEFAHVVRVEAPLAAGRREHDSFRLGIGSLEPRGECCRALAREVGRALVAVLRRCEAVDRVARVTDAGPVLYRPVPAPRTNSCKSSGRRDLNSRPLVRSGPDSTFGSTEASATLTRMVEPASAVTIAPARSVEPGRAGAGMYPFCTRAIRTRLYLGPMARRPTLTSPPATTGSTSRQRVELQDGHRPQQRRLRLRQGRLATAARVLGDRRHDRRLLAGSKTSRKAPRTRSSSHARRATRYDDPPDDLFSVTSSGSGAGRTRSPSGLSSELILKKDWKSEWAAEAAPV
jgi:hypothetical protein